MTDGGYTVYTGSDLGGEGSETEAEDASTVSWVDESLAEAEAGGYLEDLAGQIDEDEFVDPTEYAALVEQARAAGAFDHDQPDYVPPVAVNREQIREKIFAKLKRPDGTPFAAGYVSGPAARGAMYADEDTRDGAWRSGPARANEDFRTTRYEDRDTLEDRAAGADARGRVLDSDGNPIDGQWGWVIDDETRYLLLFDLADNEVVALDGSVRRQGGAETFAVLRAGGYKIRAIHHTTPVAGMPVTGAGIIVLDAGYIPEITDESGHYRPDAAQQHAAMQGLLAQGFSLEETEFKLTGRSMGPRPTDKAGWIDAAKGRNPDFPTGDVSLEYEQFKQTGGDEYQIRTKTALNAEIGRQGETPATTEGQGLVDDDEVSDDDDDDDATFIDGNGRRRRYVPDPDRPGYQISVYVNDEDESSSAGSIIGNPYDTNVAHQYETEIPDSADADSSAEDPDLGFVDSARSYLASAGRSGFAEWFRTLAPAHQDLLRQDPQIATAWSSENAPAAATTWQPAEAHQAAAATANATFVDSLDDRDGAVFNLGGFSLLIGDGHDDQHQGFVDNAVDHVTGTVTVRKAGVGRGAGSLTFSGVPPANQEVVVEAVKRFSRKQVRFA